MKKVISMMMSVFILLSMVSISVSASQSSQTINDGQYVIKIESSGKTINNYAGTNANGNKVTAWSYDGTTDQRWTAQYVGSGKYIFKTINGRVLDINHGGSYQIASGQYVDIWDYNDYNFQQFYVNPVGGGIYTLELAAFPGYVLTCNSPDTDGGRFTIEQNQNKSTQRFYFCNTSGTRIDPSYTPGSDPLQQKISQLKSKFPNGAYWNHPGTGNNPDGYSWTPCNHNNHNCDYYGNCGCNSYSNAIQCHGFALKLGNELFGSNPRNWSKVYNTNNLHVGDIVRYTTSYGEHTVFITGVSGNNITIADCNWDGHCKIRWDVTMAKSSLTGLVYVLTCQ